MIAIYQYNTTVLRATVDPDDTSQQVKDLMGQDIVTLTFEQANRVAFQRGDYCFVFGLRYTINQEPVETKADGRKYQYVLTLDGESMDFGKTQYLFLDANNNFTEAKFTLRGTPRDFCDLIIYNLNRLYPGKWSLGACIDGDYLSIDFDSNNCLEVLSTLCDTDNYSTEFYFKNYKLYLKKVNIPTGITLKFGQDNGLYSIARQGATNSLVVTRIYAFGSNQNIGDNYRGGAQRLRLAAFYLEKNVAQYGVIETTQVFDTIYPQRTGTLSALASAMVFTDAAIDFNVNDYLIPDVTAQLTFNTGLLQGYTFDINNYDDATKTFTINPNTDEQTLTLPNASLFPAVGDTYVLINILMPLAYVNAAEAALKSAAQTYLDANSSAENLLSYAITCNPIWFKRNSVALDVTQSLTLIDEDMNINRQIRITGFTRNIQNPALFGATLSDLIVPQTILVKLLNGL